MSLFTKWRNIHDNNLGETDESKKNYNNQNTALEKVDKGPMW